MQRLVRALAGASEMPPNSAAISQVWKLRCKNRQSLNPVISPLLIAIHMLGTVLNTKLIIMNRFKVKLCF